MLFKSIAMGAASAAALLSLTAACAAEASTVTFDFGSSTGQLGTSHAYTDDGLTITATGYKSANHTEDLYGKNDGGDEVGLGLNNDPTGDHEIHYGDGFVQLNVTDLIGKVQASSTDFAMNSATDGEEWAVYGSNTAGQYTGSPLLTGTTEGSQLLPDLGTYDYYDFVEINHLSSTGENVLLYDVTTSVRGVPEPAAWTMMLAGFFGLGAMLRGDRRRIVRAAI